MNIATTTELIELFSKTPIEHQYTCPDEQTLESFKAKQNVCEIIRTDSIEIRNAYYHLGYPGTLAKVYARQILVEQITQVAEVLKPVAKISIFDAFRTIETQAYLFQQFCSQVREMHPDWQQQQIEEETLKFVSHPYDTQRFTVPLHNSGGAIDLELLDRSTGNALDFGTAIDTLSELSYTDFFEREFSPQHGIDQKRWTHIRNNRRLLFNAMKHFNFVNFHHEWWHYDLGDANWASELGCSELFESMDYKMV